MLPQNRLQRWPALAPVALAFALALDVVSAPSPGFGPRTDAATAGLFLEGAL